MLTVNLTFGLSMPIPNALVATMRESLFCLNSSRFLNDTASSSASPSELPTKVPTPRDEFRQPLCILPDPEWSAPAVRAEDYPCTAI